MFKNIEVQFVYFHEAFICKAFIENDCQLRGSLFNWSDENIRP